MNLNRYVLEKLISITSQWPSDGDWDRAALDTPENLIEHLMTGMLMVLMPAGKFLTDTENDVPFKVDLPAYYIAVHPVTIAQHARFVSETGHRKPEDGNWGGVGWKNGTFLQEKANHSVVFVSLHDATAYCRWTGLRLPTELEREKAARGLDGSTYPWGETGIQAPAVIPRTRLARRQPESGVAGRAGRGIKRLTISTTSPPPIAPTSAEESFSSASASSDSVVFVAWMLPPQPWFI